MKRFVLPHLFAACTIVLSIYCTDCRCQDSVTMCNGPHYHPVDIQAKRMVDSLMSQGVDSILFYRHWLGMNGFNGYGKLVWKKSGATRQYLIELVNRKRFHGLKKPVLTILPNDSLFTSFFQEKLDSVMENPKELPGSWVSHDSEHFVLMVIGSDTYCFSIYGGNIRSSPDHPRSRYVLKLTDKKEFVMLR